MGAMSQTGTLKNFFPDKGFGFITPDDGGDDCFAHVKENSCLENCQGGETVRFDAEWDDRKGKYKAANVSVEGGGGGGGGGKGGGKGDGYSPYGGGGGRW